MDRDHAAMGWCEGDILRRERQLLNYDYNSLPCQLITAYIYTSLFTKMVVKRRKRKKYIHTKIQQTETEAEIKNKHMHNMHNMHKD